MLVYNVFHVVKYDVFILSHPQHTFYSVGSYDMLLLFVVSVLLFI